MDFLSPVYKVLNKACNKNSIKRFAAGTIFASIFSGFCYFYSQVFGLNKSKMKMENGKGSVKLNSDQI